MRLLGRNLYGLSLGCLLILGAGAGTEAKAATAPATSLTGELQALAGRAGVIFAGQVVSIQRKGGAVEVNFRVEQSVLGAAGATFTLREWAGLWPQGQFRYTVGERALVFVHPVSTAGFASPVDGADGVVPVVVQGANAAELLDIRRLAAAVQRTPGTPLPTQADGAILLSEAISVVEEALQPALRDVPARVQAPTRLRLPGAASSPATAQMSPAVQSDPVPEHPVLIGLDLAGAAGRKATYAAR